MATKVLAYSQSTDPTCWSTLSVDMTQDDRQQPVYSNGAYALVPPLGYLQIPDGSAPFYCDPSSFSTPYDPKYDPESHQCSPSGYSNDSSEATDTASANLPWIDVPLDPNAIYHMPLHGSGWPGTTEMESPYERDRTVIRQVWEQRIRDSWLRRNGITASPSDTQYDRFIPELRAGEYAERYFGSAETPLGLAGRHTRVTLPSARAAPLHSANPHSLDGYPSRTSASQYTTTTFGHHMSQDPTSSIDNALRIPSPATSGHMLGSQLLQPPYRDPPAPLSPTDASSPSSLYPNTYSSQISTSPATVLSALGSETADSPLSDIRETRSTSPTGSASAVSAADEFSLSKSSSKQGSVHHPPRMTRSRSLEGSFAGQPGMGPVRRGNSASERGKNAAGTIRVHRPAGVKWNQRTRCAYINPVTGLQCRTSAGRGPDLERHLRTVHLREEARAVSDGLIPREKAELLPPDWVMGDRLDFDCPHCAVRFTREDARDRHVKVQHQK